MKEEILNEAKRFQDTQLKGLITQDESDTAMDEFNEILNELDPSFLNEMKNNMNNVQVTKSTDGMVVSIIHKRCEICGKKSDDRCSQCKEVFYCSRKCQQKDWKMHKPVCFKSEK